VIQNIAGSAITMDGCGNTASNNTARHVGSKGISISGGEAETLTPGRSRAVNNLGHDWAPVIRTYQGGVNVYGVGNRAAHNELYNAPHTAIFFGGRNFGAITRYVDGELTESPHFSVPLGGNDNVIEYNRIHDVCLLTDDAGAIYSGRSLWDAQGTVIRNNVIYNLGGDAHSPDGIYLDDGLSGITVENNLLVNVPGLALHFSGRDLEAHGNIVVNAGRPVSYDERMRGGALDENHWFHHHSCEGGPLWTELFDSPWQTDIWRAAYPKLAAYTSNFSDTESPSFAANCAGSSVTGNSFIGKNKPNYAESVLRFSEIGPNEAYSAWKGRAYWTLPGYEKIETEKIGRETEIGAIMSELIRPTQEQQTWADLEIGVIIHMDMPTFVPEYEFRKQRGYTPPGPVFAPMQLDTDQWIRSAKAAGAKYAVLVAKHCSGVSLWPTDAHDYSIKQSPWKNGAGDIVGDFFASCEKYGLRPGLYYSASCNAYCNVDNPGTVLSGDKAEQEKYNEMVLAQLTELWTRYGDVFEIWFDGGCLPVEQGGPDIAGLLHRLQPDAVVFGGPTGTKSLLRWVGNENGIAPQDCWATVDFAEDSFDGSDERTYAGHPFGRTWSPAESDLPNRWAKKAFQGGWFWRAGEEHAIVPAEDLFDVYLKSVGRNTNMLIGMVINDRGLFPEADAAVFAQFGALVKQAFQTPIAALSQDELHTAPDKYRYRLPLPEGGAPHYLVLMEDISQGERILEYRINGAITGKCVGHKRIIALPAGTKEIVLEITEAKAEPVLRSIAVY
jgi:alpha-L-fucosidase